MLGVPAEIVIEAAVPAEAWPEPLPPVVHAAIATPMTEPAITSARTTTARVFLLPILSVRIFQSLHQRLPSGYAGLLGSQLARRD